MEREAVVKPCIGKLYERRRVAGRVIREEAEHNVAVRGRNSYLRALGAFRVLVHFCRLRRYIRHRTLSGHGEIEAIEVHDLSPRGDEVAHEAIALNSVDLGDCAELRV